MPDSPPQSFSKTKEAQACPLSLFNHQLRKYRMSPFFLINNQVGVSASATSTPLPHWAPPRLRLSYGQASVGPAGRQVGGAIIHRWSWGVLVSQYIKKRPEG